MSETFQFRNEEVSEDLLLVKCPRDHFLRGRKCVQSWRKGRMKELACVMGPHPMEDVLHMHAWLHVHIELCGKPPENFYMMPSRKMRPAELVPGRNYPVSSFGGEHGFVCVCPNGQAFAMLRYGNVEQAIAPHNWQQELDNLDISVAPLIFRKYAVIDMDGSLGLIQELGDVFTQVIFERLSDWRPSFSHIIRKVEKRNFLDTNGEYTVLKENGRTIRLSWQEVHTRLLPLGEHMVVEKSKFPPHLAPRIPDGDATHLLGWLRYPDESDIGFGDLTLVFIAFRVVSRNSHRRNDMEDVEVIGFKLDDCNQYSDAVAAPDACVDFLYL